jgi:rhodanese-related sulfurtransferase
MKRDVIQGAVLIGAAIVIAVVSNALAARERKLVLPGYYPNALTVPQRAPEPATTGSQKAPTVSPEAPPPPEVPAPVADTAPVVQKPKPRPVVEKPRNFPPHPDKPWVEIGYDDAAYLHRSGALFLDARRTSVFEQGHIAGSRPFSVWESDVDQKVNDLFNERSDPREQEKPIVVYCSGGDCEDSHMLSQKLWGVQFNNVYVYKDGFPDWQKRGGAVRVGATP